MARPREFEPDKVIEGAMQVFWQHGYEDASLPDLLKGMGLTRGSLYKAFKDKKNLFLLVLDRYEMTAVDAAVTLLSSDEIADGQARIVQLFEELVAAVAAGDHRGCLLCTAAAGSAANDPDIADAVHQGLSKLQLGLAQAVTDAPELAALGTSRRLRLAETLLTLYVGLRMLARSQLPLGILENAAQGVVEVLRGAAGQVTDCQVDTAG